jgi:transcriptional regulator with XRE-family HTH domain
MKKPVQTLGEEVRAVRQFIKKTQADFGELLGVSGNTIARWERDEMLPNTPQVLRLALRYLEFEYGKWPIDPEMEKKFRAGFRQLQKNKRELEKLIAQNA